MRYTLTRFSQLVDGSSLKYNSFNATKWYQVEVQIYPWAKKCNLFEKLILGTYW